MDNYVVASSKHWHRRTFEQFRQHESARWVYVATQDELNYAAKTIAPRYIFFLHWSWLVPTDIWSKYECVCFHMTDVPYGRGGSPLQHLILAGHGETKVTALRMVGEMDAGPVYAKRSMSLEGRAEDIYVRAGQLSWEMLKWIVEAEPVTLSQVGEVTNFVRRKPVQSALPAQGALTSIYDHIRMLDAPTYPLAFIVHGDFRIEFSFAEMHGEEIRARVVLRRDEADSDQK